MTSQSENKLLDAVLNSMHDVMYLQDREHNIVLMNKAGYKFFNLKNPDITNKKCFQLFELDKPCLNCPCVEAKKTKKVIRKEYFHPQTEQWLDVNVTLSLDDKGEVKDILFVFRDVSNERKYQKITDSYGDEMRLLVNRMPLGCIAWDEDFKVVHWNSAAEKIFGFSETEVIGKHPYEIIVPKDIIAKTDQVKSNLMKGDETAHRQGKNITKDGREIFCDWTNTPLRSTTGQIRGVLSVVQDITERMLTEQALKESETKFRDLFHKHAAVKLLIDPQNGQIIDANQAATNFYGWTTAELKAKTMYEINTLPKEELFQHMVDVVNQQPISFEVKHRLADGSEKDVSVFSSGIKTDEKTLIHVIVQDISDHKRLEAQLLQAQKMESIGRLAGGLAHDINNMLGIIMGHATIAMSRLNHSDPTFATFNSINNAGKRSAEIIHKLLAFARKEAIAPQMLDLNSALKDMLEMLQNLLEEDIELVWKPQNNLPPIKMDPSQLDQILMNLCINARDAINGVGKLVIETGTIFFDEAYCALRPDFIPGNFNILTVSDNGCGIPPGTLDKIFEPFFSTKEVGKGTGLGLSIVYGIVKQNNGFMKVYSEPGRGTTFNIYLPQYKAAIKPAPNRKTTPLKSGKGHKILLVEDDFALRKVMERMLIRNDFQVISAGTPGEALQIIKTETEEINLLITDIIMPEMNGKQLAEAICKIKPSLKVIYTSGYTANVISHHGVLEDGVNFLQKPITLEALTEKVSDVLSDQ